MKLLFLGPTNSPLLEYLRSVETLVVATMSRIDVSYIDSHKFDFLVSYGYRHILRGDILRLFPGRAINLHIAILPWNRGADPNFWSFVEKTPKGVTIHYLDEGVDTGDIITQKEIESFPDDTFRMMYDRLHNEIQGMFIENWSFIRDGICPRIKQPVMGTFHWAKEKDKYMHLLTNEWDTPVSVVDNLARNIDNTEI